MNVVDLPQRVRELQLENQRLRQTANSQRNSQSVRGNTIDFQTKYKKALKQIYEVIQANKQLKQQLDKLKTSRNKMESSIADVRKEEIYKVYDSVLREKNQLSEKFGNLEVEKQRMNTQMQALEAEVNILKGEKMYLAQQVEGLQAKVTQPQSSAQSAQQLQALHTRMREKQQQFHRTIQNYEQHHITLSNQNRKNQQRLQQLQQRLIQNDKNWRNRLESKDIQFKEIRTNVRHQYQEQINMLKREINGLKMMNTQLMTKLQTTEMDSHKEDYMTEYEVQMLGSIKELRLQMEPLKKQITELQEQNSFEQEQQEREKTQLQLKVYQLESQLQHNSLTLKSQQQKILRLNQQIKKHSDNQALVKKLQQENRIIGGRVIVLQSQKMATDDTRHHGSRMQENILQFQTRIEMLLNQKQNLANVKNISIHQLVTLKAYIAQMDQKLKNIYNQNEYAAKKYKAYKDKYLAAVKQIKTHEILENTLKSKILGYDKLVQRLQAELEKNVSIGEIQLINISSKNSQQQSQIQTFKKKYLSLKQKLLLQQKYNKQQLQTVKLNYQTKLVDLSIKAQEYATLKQSLLLYKEKNEELLQQVTQKDNELLELRLNFNKQSNLKADSQIIGARQSKEFVESLQETITKQESLILRLQTQMRQNEETARKRIFSLQKQINQAHSQVNRHKLTSSTKLSIQKSTQQLTAQNKRLKNKISELQNQIILTKGRQAQASSKNSYQLEFRVSSLQIQRNQLANRLETQISNRRRLQKVNGELQQRNNQFQTELTQVTLNSNRKIQQLRMQLNQKTQSIQTLQEQVKRLRAQQRTTLQSSSLLKSSMRRQQKDDHMQCQGKIQKLQRQLQYKQQQITNLKQQLSSNTSSYNSAFSFELESLKHDKEEYRLKIERLEKDLNATRAQLNAMEEEKYEWNRIVAGVKSQLSTTKMNHQDQLFQKQRSITQLRSKLQHCQTSLSHHLQLNSQLQQSLQQKQRQLSTLKSRLSSTTVQIQELNSTINRYNQEIMLLKQTQSQSQSTYAQQVEGVIEEKTRTLRKYEEQIMSLRAQMQQKAQEANVNRQALMRVQRELNQLKQYEEQCDKLKLSLTDRQAALSRHRFQLANFEQQLQRYKKQSSALKDQLQRTKLTLIQRQDQISSVRLQLSTASTRYNTSAISQYQEQLMEKDSVVSRLQFQLTSIQTSYNALQQEINLREGNERKLQQELAYAKSQLIRVEEELQEVNGKLSKKQGQLSQLNSEMAGLRFIEQQLNQKNQLINKLRQQSSSLRLDLSHLSQQTEFKQSTIIRLTNQTKLIRQQLNQKQDLIHMRQAQLRNISLEAQRLKSQLENYQMNSSQQQMNYNRLNTELARVKGQYKQLEQQVQERQQQFTNLQFEISQLKTQITLVNDQLQARQITIAKFANQSAFLKQQITRLNQQLVQKNHEVNRVSQQVFVQKMQYTNKTSEQVQQLNNELFSVKRQFQTMRHNLEDLESENRRLRIELEGSRIKLNEHGSIYVYTEDDMTQIKNDNNNKYREIMQLQMHVSQIESQLQLYSQQLSQVQSQLMQKSQQVQFLNQTITQMQQSYSRNSTQQQKSLTQQLQQRNTQIQLLNQKSQKLQHLLKQLQEQSHYNSEHLQNQIQQFIQNERLLRQQIQQLKVNQQQQVIKQQEQTAEELKFGLKLYTEETDRLKHIIEQLTQQVNGLKLKLSAYVNQEDRIQENLVTMVMTFAQIQSLRERMKLKQSQLNDVRKSLIQVASSSQDIGSVHRFKSSKAIIQLNENQQKLQTFEVLSQNSASIIKYRSERGEGKEEVVKEMHEFEVRSDKGAEEMMLYNNLESKRNEVQSSGGQHSPREVEYEEYTTKSKEAETNIVNNQILEVEHEHDLSRSQNQLSSPQKHEYDEQQEQHHEEQYEEEYQEIQQNQQYQEEQSQEPQQSQEHSQTENQQQLNQLNRLKQERTQEMQSSQVEQVTPGQSLPQPQESQNVTAVNTSNVGSSQQRGRTVNITYQSSQVQQTSVSQERARVSYSQYQASNVAPYVRITPQGQQLIQQPVFFSQQGMPVQAPPVRQTVSLNPQQQRPTLIQQQGPIIVNPNIQMTGRPVVSSSYPLNSQQNMRY